MFTACTICACNYLAYARVLAESFYRHHPDGTFVILLIDDEGRQAVPDGGRIVWRRLADIGLDDREIRQLAAIYDVREFSTAVKPLLLRHLLDAGAEAVMYLDPDIRVYDSLAPVWDLAARHGIVLTPHTTQPFPKDTCPVNSFYVLAAGVYNLGFIGVGPSARPFLDWWWQATRREALADVANMMFTDQRWVDFVPCLFEPHILKDAGYNVAYWNLHARELTLEGDRYRVDGVPLRFFHFSGFDVNQPWLLSRHQGDRPRVLLSDRPVLRRVCEDYRAALQQAGISADAGRPYGWDTLAAGIAFTETMRRLYRSALVEAERTNGAEPPDPFDVARPGAFLAWLNAPEEAGPRRISRYLYHLYRSRLDLQIHFRDIHGADAPRYLEWIRHDGVGQMNIPPALLPERRAPEPSKRGDAPALEEGLNIAGYFRSELGIGEAARLLVSAVEAARIPYSTITTDAGALSRQAHEFGRHPEGVAAYDTNLICVNADMTPRFVGDMGPEFLDGRYSIGYWFWEVERFPPRLHSAFDAVDEVWTATDFVTDAVRSAGRKPVFTVPVPVAAPSAASPMTRESLGLPDRFLFLFSFDFLSVFARKNPLALVWAFARAFEPDRGPVLLIKSINGHLRLNDLERLRTEIGDRPDIRLVDGYYTAAEKDALVASCDCYVSLHRSEGLGLTMAEAMAAGKPVIATAYSGNMQFMTASNSFPVDYTLSPVPAHCEPYPEGAMWAEPDLNHAIRLMRNVYAQQNEAAALGQRARAEILERHGLEASAAAIAQRLQAIRRSRRSRVTVAASAAAPPPAPVAPLPPESEALAIEATLQRLDHLATPHAAVEGRAFPGVRSAVQLGLFRLLRPFWFQHRQLHAELTGVLSQLARGLHQEREARAATDRRLAQLSGEMATAAREIGRLETEVGRVEAETGRALDETARRASADAQQAGARLQQVAADLQRVSDVAASLTERLAGLGALDSRVGQLAAGVADLSVRVADLRIGVTDLRADTTSQRHEGAAREKELTSLAGAVADLRSWSVRLQEDLSAHLTELTGAIGRTGQSLATLEHRLFAVPYMSDPDHFRERDEHGGERLGYGSTNGTRAGAFYLGFEDLFRGPQRLIRDRQTVYLPLLRQASDVVDIGCGRGEMLDLLAAVRTPAMGVDIDPDMVAMCRAKGHRVEQVDAVQFLRDRGEGALHAIFSAQVIEHMPFEQLKAFLMLCRSRLAPGGTLIVETVNPHALEAFKTFYTDLTHQRPIFPEVALALTQLAGFDRAHVVFPLGTGTLVENRQTQGEYAVVASVKRDE